MAHRTKLPILILFLTIIGGFTAFYVTGSQPQFTAYNFLLLCLAAAVSIVALGIEAFGPKAKPSKKSPQKSLRMSVGALLSMGFLGWIWISTLFSGRFISALYGVPTSLLGLISIAGLAAIALSAYRFSEEFERALSVAAPMLAVVVAVWAYVQDVSAATAGRATDTVHLGFANSSELGLFLLILLPWTLSEKFPLFKNSATAEKALRLVAAATLVYTAFWTQARMALILMVLVLIEYALSYTKFGKRSRRWIIGVVYSATLVLAGIVAIFESTNILPTSLFNIRGRLWRIGLEVFADSPLFGQGADGYQSGAMKLANFANSLEGPPLHFTDGTTSPHNIIVDIMTSFGVIGILLALAGAVTFVLYILRSKTYETLAPKNGSPAFVAAITAFFLLMTMPATINLLPLIAICAAVAVNSGVLGTLVFELTGKAKMRFRVVVLVLGSFLILLGIFDASMRLSLGPVNYYRAAPVEKALSIGTFGLLDPYFALNANNAMTFSEFDPAVRAQQIKTFKNLHTERALDVDKRDPYLALSRANALVAIDGNKREIEDLYREALYRYPGFPDASANYAIWLLGQGRNAEALEAIEPLRPFKDAGMLNVDELIASIEDAQK